MEALLLRLWKRYMCLLKSGPETVPEGSCHRLVLTLAGHVLKQLIFALCIPDGRMRARLPCPGIQILRDQRPG